MGPTIEYDEEMASPSEAHAENEQLEEKELELESEGRSVASISNQDIIAVVSDDKKPRVSARGLDFFGKKKEGKSNKKEEEEDGKETNAVHDIQKENFIDNPLDDIQPLPSQQDNTAVTSSQPGAYASRRTLSPRPFASSPRPQESQEEEQPVEVPQEDHMVEASLVEEGLIDIPMAEIVPSRDVSPGRPEQPHAEPKAMPRAQRLLFGILALLTIAVVGLAVVGVTCGTGHCNTNTSSDAALPMDTTPPTLSGTASSNPPLALYNITSEPLEDGMIRVPLADTTIDLPLYTLESLEDPSSAQARALQWLATEYGHTKLLVMEEWQKQQLFVLATLYFSLGGNGEESEEASWLNPLEPECNWSPEMPQGFKGTLQLQCTSTGSGKITGLGLYDFRQNPILPPELGLLKNLEELVIENSGQGGGLEELIPPTLVSGLANGLKQLSLGNNGRSGSIPIYFMELTQLIRLDLDRNLLSGWVPTEIGLLTQLNSMSIFGNKLSGPIPSEMGKLTALEYLSVIWNELSGTLPSELGLLQAMSSLSLFDNHLEGPIPSQLGQLQNCEELGVAQNKLTGTLPSEIGLANKMTSLAFFANQLVGEIPSELGKLTQMVYLDPAANSFTGELPSQLGLLTKLTRLGLYENNLTGSLPTQLGLLTDLKDLWMQENGFHGLLPSQLGLLPGLTWFSAYENQLEGEIPSHLGQLSQLEILDLSSNSLTGKIPSQLGQAEKLKKLALFFNNLEGSIPSELGMLSELEHFYLQENDLSGTVPESVCLLTQDDDSGLYDFALDCLEEVLCPSNCSCTSCS